MHDVFFPQKIKLENSFNIWKKICQKKQNVSDDEIEIHTSKRARTNLAMDTSFLIEEDPTSYKEDMNHRE